MALDEGTHTITVDCLGGPGYGPSTSTDLTQTVLDPGGPAAVGGPGTPSTPATPTSPRAPVTPGVNRFTG